MKKLSERHHKYLVRKSIWGNRDKKKKVNGSIIEQYSSLKLPSARLRFKNNKATLVAPEHLNLSSNADEVLDFLSVLRRVAGTGISLYVDFTAIQTLSPMCALLLTSELDRWRLFGKRKLRVVDREEWSPVVRALLSQMGFNELLNPANSFYSSDSTQETRYLRLKSGTFGDAEAAEILSENIARMAGGIENSHLLNEGIKEAMINSKRWAYGDEVDDEFKRWWITASYNQVTGDGIVMIYDHGVGIPKTVPRSGLVERYKSLLESWGIAEPDDSYWIKAAMTVGRTASGLKNRGKGLKDIQQFVLASKKGLLRVMSGRGEYRIDHKGFDEVFLHNKPLNGTLIAWQINTKENSW